MGEHRASRTHVLSRLDDLVGAEGRVMVVTNDFPPQRGGIQTYVDALCRALPPERVVVHAPAHPEAAAHDAALPYPVVRDPRTTLLPTPALARRAAETARRHDAAHVVFGAAMPLALLARALRSSSIRRVVALTHGHEVWWAALTPTRRMLRWVGSEVDALTCVSDYTGTRIARALRPADRRKLVRLVPQVDDSFHPEVDGTPVRDALGIPRQAVVVVCVARLVRRKGQDRLIRVWPRVLEEYPHAHLLIVGDGPDRNRLHRMVARRGLEASVHLVGEVAHTAEYYAAGDVYAMPVRNRFFGLEVEGLGLSYLEAAACGLHVVPGKGGGAPEAVPRRGTPSS